MTESRYTTSASGRAGWMAELPPTTHNLPWFKLRSSAWRPAWRRTPRTGPFSGFQNTAVSVPLIDLTLYHLRHSCHLAVSIIFSSDALSTTSLSLPTSRSPHPTYMSRPLFSFCSSLPKHHDDIRSSSSPTLHQLYILDAHNLTQRQLPLSLTTM